MSSLKRQIKDMELEIMADKILFMHHLQLFKYLKSNPEYIYRAMMGGFIFGFLMGWKRLAIGMRMLIARAPGFLSEVYKNAKVVMSLLSL